MVTDVSCPRCEQPVDPQARYCEHCGVDLAVAAVLAEQNIYLPQRSIVGLTPEILVPRLGDYLLEKGFIREEELDRALAVQKMQLEEGASVLLGKVLRDLELIDNQTLDQAITEQILQLQSALRQSNIQLEQRVKDRTQDLQSALEKLTELNQLKANFIANISHELRTPLAHLKGYLDVLEEGGFGLLTAPQKNAVEILKRAELRLEHLIEDLIQFSLASKGQLTLSIKPLHLEPLITSCVELAAQRAVISEIKLTTSLPVEMPEVYADEEKIHWVIEQLVDNAMKFTPKGGTVEIRASVDDEKINLVVSDTGIGIPAEDLGAVFEPFHQLDGSPTRRYGGTGLGLALCQRIVEAHGSIIDVRSQLGIGSSFSFSLPVVYPL
jgi:signal transduction histidine kinase